MRNVGESIIDKRIKFRAGLQKEFLKNIKKMGGLTWVHLAKELNISEHTLRVDWQNEKSTLPYGISKKLVKKYPFEKWERIEDGWIEKILPENWRVQLIINKNKKNIIIPKNSEEVAEIFGVILGDGHLERKTLTITGNSNEIEHYSYLKNKIKRIFGLDSSILKLKKQNSIQLKVHSIELIKFLVDNSFVLGNKIKNRAFLPRWIFEKKEFIYGALRGLFDTDGGVYQKQKGYKRAVVEFQTDSPYIRKDIFEMLRGVGFGPSKSSGNIRIQNQEEIKRFFSVVGSSNPKNIVRYRYFIKTGEIPLKEKIIEDIINIKVEEPFKAALV